MNEQQTQTGRETAYLAPCSASVGIGLSDSVIFIYGVRGTLTLYDGGKKENNWEEEKRTYWFLPLSASTTSLARWSNASSLAPASAALDGAEEAPSGFGKSSKHPISVYW